jgi:anti-sigma factor RsiW
MKQHFSEADLLETYYMQPGQSMPVMMHLADCGECAARYERLDRKMRGLTACEHHDKPESFWARQRMLVMRRIDGQRSRTASVSRISRIAAAAALAFLLGGGIWTWKETTATQSLDEARPQTPAIARTASEPLTLEVEETTDPWQSEELSDFQSVVDWETWGEPAQKEKAL